MRKLPSSTFWGSALLCATMFFFTPLTIFLGNRAEFSSTLQIVIIQTLICTALSTFILSYILSYLPPKWQRWVTTLLGIISTLFWLQSNIIGADYGVLDGTEINWDHYSTYGLIDSIAWLLVIVLGIKYSAYISKNILKLTAFLFIIQSVTTGLNLYTSPPDSASKQYTTDTSNKFTFSKNKNVIVLVLDTFQTNYFDQVLKQYPEYGDQFNGFSYFPNATAGFSTTYLSIPLILTGQYYDNLQPIPEFIANTTSDNSLFTFLKANGFKNDFFSLNNTAITSSMPLDANLLDNIVHKSLIEKLTDTQSTKNLGLLALFRGLPQPLKPDPSKLTTTILDISNATNPGNIINFLLSLKENFKATNTGPQFKFYHLWGLHPPLSINESLAYESMTFTPQDYTRAAKGCVEMIKEFIDVLKSHGVYDQSMIIIVGDHGAGLPISDNSTPQTIPDSIKGRGIPLFLIKPFSKQESLQTLTTPVSLMDIYKTIANSISHEPSVSTLPGLDILNATIPDDRSREFFSYNWSSGFWTRNQNYLPPMRKYIITGNSWLLDSWRDTREIYQKGFKSFADTSYSLDDVIDFSSKSAEKYQDSGWSFREKAGTWTLGTDATLELSNLPSNKSLSLDFDVLPFNSQETEIFLNDRSLGLITVSTPSHYRLTIPAGLAKGKEDKLRFHITKPTSPAEMHLSQDGRQLGLFFRTVTIHQTNEYIIGHEINFQVVNNNAYNWLNTGWSTPESGGTWTLGTKSELFLNTTQNVTNNLTLKASIQPLLHAPDVLNQEVMVSINDQIVGMWTVDKASEYSMTIPSTFFSSPSIHLEFLIPKATSPSSLSDSTDTRQLGILFKTMSLYPEAGN